MARGLFGADAEYLSTIGTPEGSAIDGHHFLRDAELIYEQLALAVVRPADDDISLSNKLPDSVLILIVQGHRMGRNIGFRVFFTDQVADDVNFVPTNLGNTAGMTDNISHRK